ncbi:MAG: hypothetical protein A3K90_04095 [Pelodictyon luteolum]|uniref:Uncharacterized protein n=1 Tax=Pelodictyon luteolum TaxID=1100 RepID=A0A165MBD2_PELLU|nr:MAG: hypothetical protein A3K90_04095 [Pelodictyon luteolum]
MCTDFACEPQNILFFKRAALADCLHLATVHQALFRKGIGFGFLFFAVSGVFHALDDKDILLVMLEVIRGGTR